MPFFAVYDKTSGELYSTGTEVADDDTLAERGLTAVRLTGGDGPPVDRDWNPKTKKFDVARQPPAPDTPADALAADPDFQALSAEQRALVEKFVNRVT